MKKNSEALYTVTARPIGAITPYGRNPRHNESAIAAVASSLRQFGFRKPIVVDRGDVIICGHTLYAAAKLVGFAKVPVHVAKDLTTAEVKAYRLADNKTAELAEWDYTLLPIEMADLEDFDLETLGFGAEELAELLAPAVQKPADEGPMAIDPAAEPITQRGDLWILGEHRLLCGDSSRAADVDRLVAGEPVHLLNTDPPYNVKVEPRSNNAIAAGLSSFSGTHHQGFDAARDEGKVKPSSRQLRAKDRPLENDFVSTCKFHRLLLAWFTNASRVLRPGGSFYLWGGYANAVNYPGPMALAGLNFTQAIIWIKEHPVLTRKDFMGDHEWCFYGWKAGAAHQFYGPNNVSDVWRVKKVPGREMIHLTEKPVELAARAIEYSSRPGQRVLDFFGGSGSTLLAAEQLGRRACLMELDRLYCDGIVARWERATGKKATRETDGKAKKQTTRAA